MGRMTGAFTWPSRYDIRYKCELNLSLREQPLLPALDAFGMGWVITRPSQGAVAEMLPKMTHDPTYSRWRPGGSPQITSPSLSSYPLRTRLSSSSYNLNPLDRRSLLLPSDAWSQESLRDWIPSPRSLYSTPGRLSNLGFATSSLPACANSNFQRSGEDHW